MARGGSKPGERRGGRKRGTPNKKTQEAAAVAMARVRDVLSSDQAPLDVMLANMRFALEAANAIADDIRAGGEVSVADFKRLVGMRETAQKFAADAAPYVHPKLASVEHKGDPDNPLEVVNNIILSGPRG